MPAGTKISDFWRRLVETIGRDMTVKQREVAEIFHVRQSAVTKWKTGKDTPSLPRAIEMAAKFNVCVEWLLTGRGPKTPGGVKDPGLAQLLGLWPRLTPDSREKVIQYAKLIRTVQTTAPEERIRDVHEKLTDANKKARKSPAPLPADRG